MHEFDYKQDSIETLEGIHNKLESLPKGAHIRNVIKTNEITNFIKQIENKQVDEVKWLDWPPFFLYLHRHSLEEIIALESDIELIFRQTNVKNRSNIINPLKVKPSEKQWEGKWCGGLFEIFVKSRSLKAKGLAVELDYPLPNGRDTDIRIEMEGRPFFLECTVITDSDEDRQVWDKFIEAKKLNPEVILSRPGKFDPPNPKGPSHYYDCLRVYDKVYDKIAKKLDLNKSQFCKNTPNILLISFYTNIPHPSPSSWGVRWALDELFSDQPRTHGTLKGGPPDIINISLLAYLSFTEKRLIEEGENLNPNRDSDYFNKLIHALREISAIILFDKCLFKAARINYNAKKECRISHKEMAKLENLFAVAPLWGSENL
jgi:hypothetical protein